MSTMTYYVSSGTLYFNNSTQTSVSLKVRQFNRHCNTWYF